MTEAEARAQVWKSARKMKGVIFSEDAIQAAVDRLLGRQPSGRVEVEEEVSRKRVSPLACNSYGLHEKYFPDG